MPPIDGVQFDEEKMNLGSLPPRVVPKTASEKLSFTKWLTSHGIKSRKQAEMILVGIIILNIMITLSVLFIYVL